MNIGNILIIFAIILVSMVLHEMAHAYTAYWLGDDTAKDEGRLSLNPLKHIDPMMSIVVPLLLYVSGGPIFGGAKPVPINTRNLKGGAWGMALVGVAGPLVNIILAFIAFLIGHLTGNLAYTVDGALMYSDNLAGFILVQALVCNLGFAVFNLIPIPPLDGSRVIYALAPDGVRDLMKKLEATAGIALVFILVIFFGTALSSFTSSVIHGIVQFFFALVGA